MKTGDIDALERAVTEAEHRYNLAQKRSEEADYDQAKAVSALVKAREVLQEAKDLAIVQERLFHIDPSADPFDLKQDLLSAGVRIDEVHPPGFPVLVTLSFQGCQGKGEGVIFPVALQKAAHSLLRR